MVSFGMLRRVALVRTDVLEELSASFIRVTRIGELGTTLAVTSNRRSVLPILTNLQLSKDNFNGKEKKTDHCYQMEA
jgi:hypothetical protein